MTVLRVRVSTEIAKTLATASSVGVWTVSTAFCVQIVSDLTSPSPLPHLLHLKLRLLFPKPPHVRLTLIS